MSECQECAARPFQGLSRGSEYYSWEGDETSVYKLAEAKGALVVLCYLSSNGGTTKYRLIRSLKIGRHAVEHSVEVLEELGLLEHQASGTFPFGTNLRLTRRGRALLETPVGSLPAFFWSNGVPDRRGRASAERALFAADPSVLETPRDATATARP